MRNGKEREHKNETVERDSERVEESLLWREEERQIRCTLELWLQFWNLRIAVIILEPKQHQVKVGGRGEGGNDDHHDP